MQGGAGSDSFNITTVGDITTSLYGGTFNAASGAVTDSSDDTLSGANTANTWSIGSDGASGGNTLNRTISFNGIENYIGGNADDNFTVYQQSIVGSLHGGGDGVEGDSLTIDAESESKVTWTMTGDGEGHVAIDWVGIFTGIERLIGTDGNDTFIIDDGISTGHLTGGDGTDTLVGRNQANRWTVDSINGGTVAENVIGSTDTVTFTGMENLTGGTKADLFHFTSGYVTGTITGGGGDDSLQKDDGSNSWVLTGAREGTLNNYQFVDIQTLTGGSGSDTLTGRDQANYWKVASEGGGTVAESMDAATDRMTFTGMESLVGGTNTDLFALTSGYVTGVITGGGGDDSLQKADGSNSWVLTGEHDGTLNGYQFEDIKTLNGGSGSDTLTGRNQANRWQIDSINGGTVTAYMATPGDTMTFTSMENLTGGTSTDLFQLTSGYVTGIITGGGGDDSLQKDSGSNSWVLTDAHGGTLNSYSFVGFRTLIGGTDSDTLTGRSQVNHWTVASVGGGNVATANDHMTFTGMENLTGGTKADLFQLTSGYVTGTITGGGGDDRLQKDNGSNSWVLTGTHDGTLNNYHFVDIQTLAGGSGSDSLSGRNQANYWKIASEGGGTVVENLDGAIDRVTFTGMENLIGGTHSDQFEMAAEGSIKEIQGGSDSYVDTLLARNTANTWTITADGNTLGVTGDDVYVTSFSNIDTLQGGTAVDTFAIGNAFTGNMKGGVGNDVFNIDAAVTGTLFGEAGSDRFVFTSNSNAGSAAAIDGGSSANDNDVVEGRNDVNQWAMISANEGEVAAYNATGTPSTYISLFTGIESLKGGSETDSLTGFNQANTWTITNTDAGTLEATGETAGALKFASMENLIGGTLADAFSFESLGFISGYMDGGAHPTDTVEDTLDLQKLPEEVTVELAREGSDASHVNAVNMERITANGTYSSKNKLIGANDQSYEWEITGTNAGNVKPASGAGFQTTVNFSDFGKVVGGTATDSFVVTGSIGDIDGGDGIDFVDYSDSGAVTVNLGGETVGDGEVSLSNVEGVVGNEQSTIAVSNNIYGYDWYIGATTDMDQPFADLFDGKNDGQVTDKDTATTSYFIDFGTIQGAGSNDAFTFAAKGIFEGDLKGGGGINTFDASGSEQNQNIHVNGTSASGTNVYGFSSIIGNVNTNSRLVSSGTANLWSIGSEGSLDLSADGTNDITFSGFATLAGGDLQDTFRFSALENDVARVEGGAGSATDILYLTALPPSDDFSVGLDGTEQSVNLVVEGLEQLHGGTHNSLLGSDVATNEWTITGNNTGSINGIEFYNFGNLVGGAQVDNFSLVGLSANVTGLLQGSGGADTLNLERGARGFTVSLDANEPVSGAIRTAGIEDVVASSAFTNTFISGNADDTWVISSANGGTLTNTNYRSGIRFRNFNHLKAGAGDDTFKFTNTGSLSGYIDGGTQTTGGGDTVDLRETSNMEVVLGSAGNAWRNIESVIGNAKDSTLRAHDETNTWVVNAHNQGTLNGISFDGFVNLVGGGTSNTFNVNGGWVDGYLAGASGAGASNVLNVMTTTSATRTLAFNGGTGATNIVNVTGGSDLRVATHAVSGAGTGELRYANPGSPSYTLRVTGVQQINDESLARELVVKGGDGNETYTLMDAGYMLGSLEAKFSNKVNLTVDAENGDVVSVGGHLSVPGTLTIENAAVYGADNDHSLSALMLVLDDANAVGTADQRLMLNVLDLSMSDVKGPVYLDAQGSLNLTQFSMDGDFDLIVEDDLTSDVALSSADVLRVESKDGSIALTDQGNNLSGDLYLTAEDNVDLVNGGGTRLMSVVAQDLTVNTTGAITAVGAIEVGGNTTLTSGGSILLDHKDNQLDSVRVTDADNVTIRNSDELTLQGVNASGNVVTHSEGLRVAGDIKASGLNVSANSGGVTLSGNVDIDQTVQINGEGITVNNSVVATEIHLDGGASDIDVLASLSTAQGRAVGLSGRDINLTGSLTSGGSATVRATGDVDQASNITAGSDVAVTADGAVRMATGVETQGKSVSYTSDSDMTLQNLFASGDIIVNAGTAGIDQHGVMDAVNNVRVEGGSLSMRAGGSTSASNGTVTINTSGVTELRQLQAHEQVSVNVSGGELVIHESITSTHNAVALTATGNVSQEAELSGFSGVAVESDSGSVHQRADIAASSGNVFVSAGGKVTMGESTRATATDGDIDYVAQTDLEVAALEASDTVKLTAGKGEISQVAGVVHAQRLEAKSNAGVSQAGGSYLQSEVSQLALSNQTGEVLIENNGPILVEKLRNNGDISIVNNGDLTLDTAIGTPYKQGETDANVAGGTANANYDLGTLNIRVNNGSLLATGVADASSPDIVGFSAGLIATEGTIGSRTRPLVIYTQDTLFIEGITSWQPIWAFNARPRIVQNASTIQSDLQELINVASEQMVEVESLKDLDPAIFANITNFFYNDISVLLPSDQRYDDEELY